MASELLQATHNGSRVKHDEKSDIWAFGMVIYVRMMRNAYRSQDYLLTSYTILHRSF